MSTQDPRMDDWATHVPALIACLEGTCGPVLEVGVGIWSTPILHAACAPGARRLVSLEANPGWLSRFVPLQSETHAVRRLGTWDEAPALVTAPELLGANESWAVAFVDHGQAPRGPVVAALRGRAELVVMHDSECHYCGYGPALAAYDWAYTHTHSPTWTTVAGMGTPPPWLTAALQPGIWGVPPCYRG